MHAIMPKASNTAIMFGTTRSHQSLLAIPVFHCRSPWFGKNAASGWEVDRHPWFYWLFCVEKSKNQTVRTIDESPSHQKATYCGLPSKVTAFCIKWSESWQAHWLPLRWHTAARSDRSSVSRESTTSSWWNSAFSWLISRWGVLLKETW